MPTVQFLDQQVLSGPDAAGAVLRQALSAAKFQSVAVFASPSVRRSGLLARILGSGLAGTRVVAEFHEVQPGAPANASEAIAASLAGESLDALIAIGGGSVIDTAKAVAVLLAGGGQLERYCVSFTPPDDFHRPELPRPKLPVVAVPGTLTGSEMTPSAGATINGVKRTFRDFQIAPRMIAFDPSVLSQTPPSVLLASGLCALAHCIEGMYSPDANPITTAMALAGTRLLASNLPAVLANPNAEQPYQKLGDASVMAGIVIANNRGGLQHAVCHAISGGLGISQSAAHAIMLPAVLRFNLPATRTAQHRFAAAMAECHPDDGERDASIEVERLVSRLAIPSRLRDVGVGKEQLEGIAAETMKERGTYLNPRPVTSSEDVLEVLRDAY